MRWSLAHVVREYVKVAFQHYRHTAATPMSIRRVPKTARITTMRLQDELDARRDKCYENTPPHIWRVRQEAIDDLVSTGIAESAIHAGDHAPEFRLRDPDGKVISSYDLLNRGPVLIFFYRGGWCPYCNLDLRAIQAVAQQFRSSGASIVAVSQQSAHESRSTERMNGLSFSSLVDRGGEVARAFGVRWKLPRELRATEIESGLDLAAVNGEPSWTLTMPARYVISREGIIEYADISADYTRRCDPTELFPVLSQIRARLAH
jgi:peroxiredoxin